MEKSKQYACREVVRLKPYWVNQAGILELPPEQLANYLVSAYLEGHLDALREIQAKRENRLSEISEAANG